jgi:hypothetical protein
MGPSSGESFNFRRNQALRYFSKRIFLALRWGYMRSIGAGVQTSILRLRNCFASRTSYYAQDRLLAARKSVSARV